MINYVQWNSNNDSVELKKIYPYLIIMTLILILKLLHPQNNLKVIFKFNDQYHYF
jgi:hypothetical protein